MFGGLAILINGRGGLFLRVDPADAPSLISDPLAEHFVMRGQEMGGWLHVTLDATAPPEELERWVSRGVAHARSLPPKGA